MEDGKGRMDDGRGTERVGRGEGEHLCTLAPLHPCTGWERGRQGDKEIGRGAGCVPFFPDGAQATTTVGCAEGMEMGASCLSTYL